MTFNWDHFVISFMANVAFAVIAYFIWTLTRKKKRRR